MRNFSYNFIKRKNYLSISLILPNLPMALFTTIFKPTHLDPGPQQQVLEALVHLVSFVCLVGAKLFPLHILTL